MFLMRVRFIRLMTVILLNDKHYQFYTLVALRQSLLLPTETIKLLTPASSQLS